MCYDISFTVKMRQLSDYFPGLVFDNQLNFDFGPVDHIQGVSVFGAHPIIFQDRADGALHCRMMEWSILNEQTLQGKGLQDKQLMSKRNGMLNIRSERVLDDAGSYWHKIMNQRCLVPVTGIFEHREVKGRSGKIPYWVGINGEEVFFLPGLYNKVELIDESGTMIESVFTFALMTREANDLMRNVHNSGPRGFRMPLFLHNEMAKEFVSNDLGIQRYREILNYLIPSEDLAQHPVFKIRGTASRPDDKQKHEAFVYQNLPALGTMNPNDPSIQKSLFE